MRRVRITEGQLHRIIKHAVNEALDDDNITNVDDSGDNANYKVSLWPGNGYSMSEFTVKAEEETEALEKVIAWLDNEDDDSLFADSDVDRMDEEEKEEMEDNGQIMYVDGTEFGANNIHYIWSENLRIERI